MHLSLGGIAQGRQVMDTIRIFRHAGNDLRLIFLSARGLQGGLNAAYAQRGRNETENDQCFNSFHIDLFDGVVPSLSGD